MRRSPAGELSPFDCVSPLDFRYYGTDRAVFALLHPYLSERARVRYELGVEAALVEELAAWGVCSAKVAAQVRKACAQVTAEEVQKEEQRIQHNIRALVNCIRAKLPPSARRFVHFTLTSFDVIDTATAMRFRDAAKEAVIPRLLTLEKTLIALARREKNTLQIGRTHGQFAVPITFGFAVAEYVSRLGNRILALEQAASSLRGKISGAVGAYNAGSLLISDPIRFERSLLKRLGLEPATQSTQIVEAESLLDYLHAVCSCLGVLANLADDMRNLQRSEISEVGEVFEGSQVGSSTMPHKRNPWNFENVKSMWKEFAPRMMTRYLDQISEHQRDLTNSASGRFAQEMVVGLVSSVERLNRFVPRLVVDRAQMKKNLEAAEALVVAEPLYILLAAAGHPDAHEAVRKLALKHKPGGPSLVDLASHDRDLLPYIKRLTLAQKRILEQPSRYTGLAAKKSEQVCTYWERRLKLGK